MKGSTPWEFVSKGLPKAGLDTQLCADTRTHPATEAAGGKMPLAANLPETLPRAPEPRVLRDPGHGEDLWFALVVKGEGSPRTGAESKARAREGR